MIKRIFDIPENNSNQNSVLKAFSAKRAGEWKSCSYSEYSMISDDISLGLMDKKIKKGDRIITITTNRPEWNFLDKAITQVGGIHVPLYPNYSIGDFRYIISAINPKIIFVSNRLLIPHISRIVESENLNSEVIGFEDFPGLTSLSDLVESGKKLKGNGFAKEFEIQVNEDDLAAIYFTSGTGGLPKGVMVSHKNILSSALSMKNMYNLNPGEKVLSYLPLNHSFESVHSYIYQYYKAHVFYAESVATVGKNLREIKPVMFCGVPLLLEKIVSEFIAKIKLEINDKDLLTDLAETYKSDWIDHTGGNLRYIAAGGASLPESLALIYNAFGVEILEIYGMTETYAISVNSAQRGIRFGTVGTPEPHMQVEIADDGEILCKGPSVTRGYFNDPQLTKEMIDSDGWFHTGDYGAWIDGKFLKITGRKKNAFKTSSGIFIQPEEIEKMLKSNSFVMHAVVAGKDRNFLTVIVCIKQAESSKEAIRESIQQTIDHYNRNAWATSVIRHFIISNENWSVETGELTPVMKVKREVILKRYEKQIQEFYS